MRKAKDMKPKIESVKVSKAAALYWQDVRDYGSETNALNALDCRHGTTVERRTEAIKMLSAVQEVRVFRRGGKVFVQ